MYKWIILMSGLFASLTACAKVKLSPLFSDNMVLQQEAEVPVWGKASPEMTLSFRNNGWRKSKIGECNDW